MTNEVAQKIRELIEAEAYVVVAGNEEDESGYRGNNHREKEIAERVFKELLILINK